MMSRLDHLRLLLLGGVSHVSLNRACSGHAWAEFNRGTGQAPQATAEAPVGAVKVYRKHNKPGARPATVDNLASEQQQCDA
jgi:hypothetical protein